MIGSLSGVVSSASSLTAQDPSGEVSELAVQDRPTGPVLGLTAAVLAAFGLLSPWLAPSFTFQVAVLWIMILFALTWDTMGGQMGYNSLGNIFFFGFGMYISAMAALSCGTEALMLGSLMMLASGVLASRPSSAR